MTWLRTAGLTLGALLIAAAPALAQKSTKQKTTAPATTEEPAAPSAGLTPGAAPPYESQLLRLAEILGGLHYIRDLCKSGEGDLWREQMQALIDSETPDFEEKRRMVDRFNRGYESFRSVYLTCTPAAAAVSERYLDEGARIAADITARYGR
jgi:uncharacterized protein (TIGR02301 family)